MPGAVIRWGSECLPARGGVLLLTLLVIGYPIFGVAQVGKSGDLEDDVFWTNVSGCRNAAEVELYLSAFPSGRHVEEARACLKKLGSPNLTRLLGRRLIAGARDSETGWTDLHYAAAANLPEEIANLIEAGVPVDARLAWGGRDFGEQLQKVLSGLGHGEVFQVKRTYGETALMIAAMVGAKRAAAALVEYGADILAKNDYGMTPLHYAAWGDSVSALEWLVSRGADIHAKDNVGDTPLHFAASGDSVSALEWLVSRGADIHAKDKYGHTPLHDAARGDSVSALE